MGKKNEKTQEFCLILCFPFSGFKLLYTISQYTADGRFLPSFFQCRAGILGRGKISFSENCIMNM